MIFCFFIDQFYMDSYGCKGLMSIVLPQTEKDENSLFHAASLGFWGVHDRTSLLCQAVSHTLSDPKAQFLIYDRWSDEIARSMPAGSKPVSSCGLAILIPYVFYCTGHTVATL